MEGFAYPVDKMSLVMVASQSRVGSLKNAVVQSEALGEDLDVVLVLGGQNYAPRSIARVP